MLRGDYMDFAVNANTSIKVKLTEFGVFVLREQHDQLNNRVKAHNGKGIGEFELHLDEDGYYETQLWMLMSKFGHVVSMGNEIPFHLDMIIRNGKPLKNKLYRTLTDKEWESFGYDSDKDPCDICGKTPTKLEPRFYYATCKEHASIPPAHRDGHKNKQEGVVE